MKLEQLEQVIEISKTRSISKAAANLFLSQPSLSASIKQLENELGTEIFGRTRKGVELTPFGMTFVKYAEKIVEQVNSLGKLCKENIPHISQTLSVAHGNFRFASIVVAMMINKHKDDGARFILRNGINEDVIDWVAEGICDVGVIAFKNGSEREFKQIMKLKQLQHQVIYRPPTKVIVGTGHPLFYSSATEVSVEELEAYPAVSYDDTSAKNYLRSVYVRTGGKNLRVIVTDRASMYEMLEFSPCYSLGFSNDIVYGNIPRKQQTRTLNLIHGKTAYSVAWIASANAGFMPLAKEYIELLNDVCTRTDFWNLHPDITINPSKQP